MTLERGRAVEIVNPKHPRFGKLGVIERMDRGNVWVRLVCGEIVCTRSNALAPPTEEK